MARKSLVKEGNFIKIWVTFLAGLKIDKGECLFFPVVYIEELVAVSGEELAEFLSGDGGVEVADVNSI